MKKLTIIVLLAIAAIGQVNGKDNATDKVFTIDGKVYSMKESATKKEKVTTITDYYYKHSDGVEHQIILSSNGHAYIMLTSKSTGKEYRKYLGEEISRDLCEKCGIEYKATPKKTSK